MGDLLLGYEDQVRVWVSVPDLMRGAEYGDFIIPYKRVTMPIGPAIGYVLNYGAEPIDDKGYWVGPEGRTEYEIDAVLEQNAENRRPVYRSGEK